MPFPNEHAARQADPKDFERFIRISTGFPDGISAIIGYTADGKSKVQSFRFDKKKWTPAQAKKWLKDHGMKVDLEPAVVEPVKKGLWSGVL